MFMARNTKCHKYVNSPQCNLQVQCKSNFVSSIGIFMELKQHDSKSYIEKLRVQNSQSTLGEKKKEQGEKTCPHQILGFFYEAVIIKVSVVLVQCTNCILKILRNTHSHMQIHWIRSNKFRKTAGYKNSCISIEQ